MAIHCRAAKNSLRGASTELRLASSKILTPHPPLHPASVSSPRNIGGEDTLAGRRGGWGVIIWEDARHRIGLLQ
jgi:hypothetical protein